MYLYTSQKINREQYIIILNLVLKKICFNIHNHKNIYILKITDKFQSCNTNK